MKKLLSALIVVAAALPLCSAHAMTAQQEKMAACNKEAGDKQLKGDERKQFMRDCLKKTPPASAQNMSQQEKMKVCNKEAGAKQLKGGERKEFMRNCLKG
ncbi:MAG: PsiF family protein [Betaproteobacteria bacterium]|nr:PsiF family protein [Betaproteobacteria bacterium]